MCDQPTTGTKDPFSSQSEPDYEGGNYLISQFVHVTNGRDPWWFTKDELEQLVELMNQYNGPGNGVLRPWTMEDASSAKYDDRIRICGGPHDALVRKKFVLSTGEPVYDVLIDGRQQHAANFKDVKLYIQTLFEHTAYVDAMITRMSRDLVHGSLDLN